MESVTLRPVARIENGFQGKFGVPRQSGLVDAVISRIVFEPEMRSKDAIRGIGGFSHLWLIWGFSLSGRESSRLTVRPPRLGGNERVGVFASRSPFRPNPIGLSCVKLLGIEQEPGRGSVLMVGGADLVNGTPIYDIKPYLPYTDCRTDATGGFADSAAGFMLRVSFPQELLEKLPVQERDAALQLLSHDPRPAYQEDSERIYGMTYSGYNIRFTVHDGELGVIEVTDIDGN